ncbi:MAG TPA: 16S rRNA (cytosine(967)-C(5))-methyltransferase RsmB [Moraxellaceae bacterium]|nr:16S rRNA (cytosine(967)-C(5))-methyltransferase RsmB [Moraxellaceae bacterium]
MKTARAAQTLSARALAARALAPVLAARESLSDTLPGALSQVAPQDRGLLQAIAFTTCRHALLYRALLAPLLQRPPQPLVEALLLSGLAQLRDLRIPDHAALSETVNAARELKQDRVTGLINAVLRRYLRERESLEADAAGEAHAHPAWLKRQLEQDWGPDTAAAIMAANNAEASVVLRVNARQGSRDAYLQALSAESIAASACTWCDDGIRLDAPVGDVRALPGFAAGAVSVQDEAAQLCAPLLACDAGMHVLDACAAPGGKTAHLLERTPGLSLLALDIDPARCARIDENLQRLRLDGAQVVAADAADTAKWWDGATFDRILLDAPCTATGVIRRHPDIKLLRRESDVMQTARLQAKLLRTLWPLLKPGGVMLYVTCSVLKIENEEQIKAFLASTPDAAERPILSSWGEARPQGRQLLPGNTDGFYFALLEKRALSH